MRLAVALGCARPYEEQDCLPSEKAHRVRVWWTAFMLDRYVMIEIPLSFSFCLVKGPDADQSVATADCLLT